MEEEDTPAARAKPNEYSPWRPETLPALCEGSGWKEQLAPPKAHWVLNKRTQETFLSSGDYQSSEPSEQRARQAHLQLYPRQGDEARAQRTLVESGKRAGLS